MGFLLWIIIGGLAGWAASLIMKTREGLLLNIIVGIENDDLPTAVRAIYRAFA